VDSSEKPRLDLAEQVLPGPLFDALANVFSQPLSGCMLVGGSALSGFYAGHRRSDDLDLFTANEDAQVATYRAVQSLRAIGVTFEKEFHTPGFFKGTCVHRNHRFTIDIVKETNLFRFARSVNLPNGIVVADLDTLFITKAATLVSRCSEKDLYDLLWLFDHLEGLTYETLIEAGAKLDTGVTGESLLLSVSGTVLREEACGFSLDPNLSAKSIHAQLVRFFLRDRPPPPLKDLVRQVRRWVEKEKK
jgi:hypothetical protein